MKTFAIVLKTSAIILACSAAHASPHWYLEDRTWCLSRPPAGTVAARLLNRCRFPDGIAVPEFGYAGWSEIGSEAHAPAGAFLSVAENSVGERSPPVYWH